MGYHLNAITKGELGESSKIAEELAELQDAEAQGNRILVLCELADLYGAIELYLENHLPNFGMGDLAKMSKATARAFEEGER